MNYQKRWRPLNWYQDQNDQPQEDLFMTYLYARIAQSVVKKVYMAFHDDELPVHHRKRWKCLMAASA